MVSPHWKQKPEEQGVRMSKSIKTPKVCSTGTGGRVCGIDYDSEHGLQTLLAGDQLGT